MNHLNPTASPDTPKCAKQPEIHELAASLNQAVDDLYQTLCQLAERLFCVSAPRETSCLPDEPERMTDLGKHLSRQVLRIRQMNCDIDQLVDALQV